jgi:hypothetical protein
MSRGGFVSPNGVALFRQEGSDGWDRHVRSPVPRRSRGQREGEGEFPAYQGKYQGILKNLDDPIAPETTRLIPVLNTQARRAIADPAAGRTINGMGLCYRTITFRQGSSDDRLVGRQDESYCGRIQRPHAVR